MYGTALLRTSAARSAYAWLRALSCLLALGVVPLAATGCSSSFCYGSGCDQGSVTFGTAARNYTIQNKTNRFHLSSRMAWVAKFTDTVRTTEVTIQALDRSGKHVLGSIPLTDILSEDKSIDQFEVTSVPVQKVLVPAFHLPGPGTYVMRYVDKSDNELAEGTFTITT